MKFNYTVTRKQYKKIISNYYNKVILILLLGYSVLFFVFGISYIKEFFRLFGMIYFISIIFLFMFSIIFKYISIFINLKINDKVTNKSYGTYNIEINEDEIILNINDNRYITKFNDIKKLKLKKNKLIIIPKNSKVMITISKKQINNIELYNQITNLLNNNYKAKK